MFTLKMISLFHIRTHDQSYSQKTWQMLAHFEDRVEAVLPGTLKLRIRFLSSLMCVYRLEISLNLKASPLPIPFSTLILSK